MASIPRVASMTTYPPRYAMAVRAMKKISKDVDHLFLYVNGSQEENRHPRWDKAAPSNATVFLGDEEAGDLGDVGKFYALRYITGQAYVYLVDDDIRYPDDYFERMAAFVDKYDRRYVVGVHACDIPDDEVVSYYGEGQVNKAHFSQMLTDAQPAHVLGTGTVAFWSELISVSVHEFPVQNMADLFFARYCQKEEIGMVAVPRAPGWLKGMPTPDEGIWGRFQGQDEIQTWLVNRSEWNHHAHTKE